MLEDIKEYACFVFFTPILYSQLARICIKRGIKPSYKNIMFICQESVKRPSHWDFDESIWKRILNIEKEIEPELKELQKSQFNNKVRDLLK